MILSVMDNLKSDFKCYGWRCCRK